ncbi:UV excision repair protein rad23 [Malassezia brasiliensis]|uniref:UV excision repair protein RAD23 n=1 Tax=Malassezia brasiliensis TaxID=1821822 RepID=A0AAF0DXQ5_9BASI|nr:UV excision repair protein rad23 [Malassezia brasiliensis]
MKLLVKSLAGGNFHLDVEPSETIGAVKESIHKQQGHAVELQKLIFSGKILENDKTIESYGIKEKDFLVVMVSKPKAAKPAPKAEEPKKEDTAAAAPSAAADAPSAPAAEAPAAAATMSGPELESAISNIVEMGFPREDVQRAMRMSYNNPDRAVDYLMNGLPSEPAPQASPAAPTPSAGSGATDAPRSGNLFEQAAAQAARGSAAPGADVLPGEDDGQGRQLIDLGNPQVLGQLRALVEQNPAALQPLIQALVQSNPQLAEALSADPEGVLRMLAGGEGLEPLEGEESFELPTLQQLSEEDRGQVEQIIAMGIPESKAIESYFMCGRNLEMAVQYYFENPQDFED